MIPMLKVDVLGRQLRTLGGDDGALLADILAQLRVEVEREPGNLVAATAYSHALFAGGLRAEAIAQAERAFHLWRKLPAVPAGVTANVASGLADARRVADAKWVLERLDGQPLQDRAALRYDFILAHIGMRFGELEWLWQREPAHQLVRFLVAHGLAEGWTEQQQAVEALLGDRTSSVVWETIRLESDAFCLACDYFTDATSYQEIDDLQQRLWDELERVRGPLFDQLLHHTAFLVHGPRIPLQEMQP